MTLKADDDDDFLLIFIYSKFVSMLNYFHVLDMQMVMLLFAEFQSRLFSTDINLPLGVGLRVHTTDFISLKEFSTSWKYACCMLYAYFYHISYTDV